MNKHTPGPWRVGELRRIYAQNILVTQTFKDPHGIATEGIGRSEAGANAQLIESAPELLELAEQVLALATVEMPKQLIEAAEKVIAKVKGASS